MAIGAVGVEDVNVGELEAGEGGCSAFDEVFAREAEVVDFGAGWGVGGVVRAPVDLRSSIRDAVTVFVDFYWGSWGRC